MKNNCGALASRYQTANRQVGRCYSRILSSKTINRPVTARRQKTADILLAKRDYLAHKLHEKQQALTFNALLNDSGMGLEFS